jgi:chromosomal replication initiator protein
MLLLKSSHWEEAMDRLRIALGNETYEAWLRELKLEDFSDDGRLTLAVPGDFYLSWIEKRYLGDIQKAFSESISSPVRVELVVAGDGHEAPQATDETELPIPSSPRGGVSLRSEFPEEEEAPRRDVPLPRLNPRYSFDEFVVGESNRFAHAAALAVSDPKSRSINPLFIYGGSGLGKTHLMHAVGHHMHAIDRTLRVCYLSSEQFINGFIEAIQNKRHTEFRQMYRNVDLLLIDDVQFLMGKERTQQEFFFTFNALYDAGKKVVVTSDRPPRQLSTLEDRLRSRFEWGLMVDIQPPDLETRMAILRKKAGQEGIHLPNDVILYVAERVTKNIREMEGHLKKLKMTVALHSRPIDLAIARDVLGPMMLGTPTAQVTVEDVQRAVCEFFKIKVAELQGANRSKRFSQPRHVAQYLSRKLTGLSFPDIAQKFGGKDHTSIIYACRKVEQGIANDPNTASVVAFLSKQVTKGAEQ